LGWRVKRTKR
jgi:hypothetical protein